ncbi:MAG TPA: S-methyl-5-thioribose-1-phosphate isomerase, partial [Acidimicrobiales bacterium]|nr:S-methyl-5-thioribose-1-phosphate isomerase [Acidimicrobiales bacterium]
MRTIEYDPAGPSLRLIDQTRLPASLEYLECRTWSQVAAAIREMRVRGAPAIGVAAAFGLVLAAEAFEGSDPGALQAWLRQVADALAETRPTAVNLFWALEQGRAVADQAPVLGVEQTRRRLAELAERLAREDEAACRTMGAFGAALVPDQARILTHCNAGALATVGYGTALGVIRAAAEAGKRPHVYVDETRPFLQGARLTAWELQREGIPLTLITDSMAGHFLSRGQVDLVVVGADRIAANGDVVNKIGTYTLAVLCKENGVPFYVAAPISTLDLNLPTGLDIPIEERSSAEVVRLGDQRIAPDGVQAAHPAFDLT